VVDVYDRHKLNLAGLVPPASDFMELLGATRAESSELARCHGATERVHVCKIPGV
jgi:hypothetical protein